MFDEFTLGELSAYIDNRMNKYRGNLKFYKRDDFRYITYKNLIMELQIVKDFIKSRKVKK